MAAARDPDPAREHWEREDLATAVLEVLAASGKDLDALTIDDLAPLDQFHGGGLAFTRRLAALAGLAARFPLPRGRRFE